ncbi:DUF3768 domain-containing protein [Nereida ignava]|uniref:DUF3768 domain-containing protein n=1 Tax=Nereida ignava TaxID=282199 RepID=UPI003F6C6B87
MPDATTAKIAALNDHARRSFTGCRVIITQGVQALDDVPSVLDQVRRFDAFTPDNDPYEEHDFGSIHHSGQTVFWKFDYWDVDLTMHSPDLSDPAVTARVLTIMLADEY